VVAAWALAARAQQAKQQRIAIFHPAIPTTHLTETGGENAWRAFFGELRRLGYVEGENLIIERYSAEGHHERYSDLVREIVTRNPDVIVTGTNPVVIAFPGFKTVSLRDIIVQPGSKTPENQEMMNAMVCHITEGELRLVQDGKPFTAKKDFVWACNKGTIEHAANDGSVVAIMRITDLKA
jgi:hypothetical protein